MELKLYKEQCIKELNALYFTRNIEKQIKDINEADTIDKAKAIWETNDPKAFMDKSVRMRRIILYYATEGLICLDCLGPASRY